MAAATRPTRLARSGIAQGDSASRPYIPCAFCGGSGRDPFGLLSPLALCGVCQGKGQVKLQEPAVECAFCSGTGIYPLGSRLTCTACGGKGVLTVAEPRSACPECQGTGKDPQSGSALYCLRCRGAGVVPTAPSTPVSSFKLQVSRTRKLKNSGEGVAQMRPTGRRTRLLAGRAFRSATIRARHAVPLLETRNTKLETKR